MNDEQDRTGRYSHEHPERRYPGDPSVPQEPHSARAAGHPYPGPPLPAEGHAAAGHDGAGYAVPGHPTDGERPSAPRTSWGGESDADATAFVQLPDDGWAHRPAGAPPAAPGQGYRPPEIGTAAGPWPAEGAPNPGGPGDTRTGAPAADPAPTGEWQLPFAGADAPDGAVGGPDAEPQSGLPASDQRWAGVGWGAPADAEPGWSEAAGPAEPAGAAESAESAAAGTAFTAGDAAAMGQGAAAALAGFRQGQGHGTLRRETGTAEEAADGAGALDGSTLPASGTRGPAKDSGESSVPTPEPILPAAQSAGASASGHPTVSYTLHVNGVDRHVTSAWIGESLLHVLRERLGLAGAKDGCAQGECGACSVQVDGRLVMACLVPGATAAGSDIRTVEGLASDGAPSDVQRALADTDVQCGFCLPGMAMTVHDLLEGNHRPTALEAKRALSGNLCRCSGYRGVLNTVRQVADERSRAAQGRAPDSPDRGNGAGPAPSAAGPGTQPQRPGTGQLPEHQDHHNRSEDRDRDHHDQHPQRESAGPATGPRFDIPRQAGSAGREGDT